VTLRQLVLWRHGETDFNVARRIQGQLDSKLTPVGLSQAHRAARWLAELQPAVLMTSDLSRAGDTAAVLAAETGIPLRMPKSRHFARAACRPGAATRSGHHRAARPVWRWPLGLRTWSPSLMQTRRVVRCCAPTAG
jgi:broad specificity phosphatase PhoE